MWETNQKNKEQGALLEKLGALYTGLTLTPGSGCGRLFKGDLVGPNWLVEIKSTRKAKFVFDTRWWIKAEAQAKEKLKQHAGLLFGWITRPSGYTGALIFGVVLQTENTVPKYVVVLGNKTTTIPITYLENIATGEDIALLLPDKRFLRVMPIGDFNTYVQNNSN